MMTHMIYVLAQTHLFLRLPKLKLNKGKLYFRYLDVIEHQETNKYLLIENNNFFALIYIHELLNNVINKIKRLSKLVL